MATNTITAQTTGREQLDRLVGLFRGDLADAITDEFADTAPLVAVMRSAIYETGIQRQTGTLEASASFDVTQQDWPVELTAAYGQGAEYARYLDEGTRYIRPYGFLALASERLKPLIETRVNRAITRYLRAGAG